MVCSSCGIQFKAGEEVFAVFSQKVQPSLTGYNNIKQMGVFCFKCIHIKAKR